MELRYFFEERIVNVSYNARISGSLSLLLYQTGSKVKSTWMEGVSGKVDGAGFCNSEGYQVLTKKKGVIVNLKRFSGGLEP